LNFRREHGELFQTGEYLPLYGEGKFRGHVCAFARRLGARWIIAAAPRLMMRLVGSGSWPLGDRVWQQERLDLPAGAPAKWRNILTGESLRALPTKAGRSALLLHEIFASFPVAPLGSEPEAEG